MTDLWNPLVRSQEPFSDVSTHDLDAWVRLASMERLGASVQELAREQLESIFGYNADPENPIDGGHKPPRPDIQKMMDVYGLYQRSKTPGERSSIGDAAQAATEWQDKYTLTTRERGYLAAYNMLMRDYHSQEHAFQALAAVYDSLWDTDSGRLEAPEGWTPRRPLQGPTYDPKVDEPPSQQAKKAVGQLLKKNEEANLAQLYPAMAKAIMDLESNHPESYKLWPWFVKHMKDDYTSQCAYGYLPELGRGQLNFDHEVDVVGEGGKILNQLRQENKIPQNFDIAKLNFKEFEEWLMEWKRDNRESLSAGAVVYDFGNGYTIQKLTTPEQLQFEGDEMGHCVGGYHYQVERGDTIIYSLRDSKNIPHVTIEIQTVSQHPFSAAEPMGDHGMVFNRDAGDERVHPDTHKPEDLVVRNSSREEGRKATSEDLDPFEVVQMMGNSNKTPKPEYQRMVKEWLNSLKEKGWKFKRSEDYMNPFDQQGRQQWDYESMKTAQELDEWYDNTFRDNHEMYRHGGEDEYGVTSEREHPDISDWDEILQDYLNSLADNYDRNKWNTNDWRGAAHACYTALCTEDWAEKRSDPEYAKRAKDIAMRDIEKAEQELNDWAFQLSDYMEISDGEVEEQFFKNNHSHDTPLAFDEDGEFDPELARENYEDEWYESKSDLEAQEADAVYGDAYKFISYLYNLVYTNGLALPQDLPDPNQENRGLPTYEDLTSGPPEQAEVKIPGALSKVATMDDDYDWVPRPKESTAFVYDPMMQQFRFGPNHFDIISDMHEKEGLGEDEWIKRGMIKGRRYTEGGIELNTRRPDLDIPAIKAACEQAFIKQAASPYRIVPIDLENNTWIDEDGKEHPRFRAGWKKNVETNKMEQTGELEDTFLDRQGRQGQGVVALHGDKPVGSMTYVEDPNGWNMLGTVYVHPDHREQGLFNQMVAPLRASGKPIDAYHWNNPWLKNKVRGWNKGAKISKTSYWEPHFAGQVQTYDEFMTSLNERS